MALVYTCQFQISDNFSCLLYRFIQKDSHIDLSPRKDLLHCYFSNFITCTFKSQYWCLKSDMIPRWHLGSRFTKTLDFFFTQPLWNLTSPTYSQNRCKDTSTNHWPTFCCSGVGHNWPCGENIAFTFVNIRINICSLHFVFELWGCNDNMTYAISNNKN